jgi:hypothetical protein
MPLHPVLPLGPQLRKASLELRERLPRLIDEVVAMERRIQLDSPLRRAAHELARFV